jgi:hypothetical protein
MKVLGRVSSVALVAAAGLGLVGCGQAAQGEHLGEARGFVILDKSAREAGVRLDGVSSADAVLPVEISPLAHEELVGPNGRVALEVKVDEVVYVHGGDLQIERGKLDDEVARDRVAVVGHEEAARELAEEIGGVVDRREGRLVVVGPDALVAAAHAAIPTGLDEVVPVLPGDAAGRPAFASAFGAGIADAHRGALRELGPTGKSEFDLSSFVKARIIAPADELLPEAVDCTDPIAGVWVSREHYAQYNDWYRFELVIQRDPRDASQLVGGILSRSWSGPSERSAPAVCAGPESDEFDWTVRMDATGSFSGAEVRFDGQSRHTEATRCGPAYAASRYNVDHFHGRLIQGGRFLQAVNNDGDRSIDDPHVFRRVACR